MSLFYDPSNDVSSLERLHYRISRCLWTRKIITQCEYPIQPKSNISCDIAPQDTSNSKNFSLIQVVKTIIEHNSSIDTYNNDNFVRRVLSMMELKHNEELFNFTVKKVIAGNLVMPWLNHVRIKFRRKLVSILRNNVW